MLFILRNLACILLCCILLGSGYSQVRRFTHPVLEKTDSLLNARKYSEAIKSCKSLARKLKKSNDPEGYIASLVRAAEIETFEVWKAKSFPEIEIREDHNRSLALIDEMLQETGERIYDYPYLAADALFIKAVNLHWLKSRDSSLILHEKSLKIKRDIYPENHEKLADSYEWLGSLFLWGYKNLDSAAQNFQKALDVQELQSVSNPAKLAHLYYEMASINREMRQIERAINLVNRTIDQYEKIQLPREVGFAKGILANIYYHQLKYGDAIDLYLQQIDLFKKIKLTNEQLIPYSNLASTMIVEGDFPEAKKYLLFANNLIEKSENPNPYHVTQVYLNLGIVYRHLEVFDSSEYFFTKSIEATLGYYGPNDVDVGNGYYYSAKLYLDKENFEKALDNYQKGLAVFTQNKFTGSLSDLRNLPPNLNVTASVFGIADLFFEWYKDAGDVDKLDKAYSYYKLAYELYFKARQYINDEESRVYLLNQFLESVENSIECTYELQLKDPLYAEYLFQFLESNKYLLVFDALQRTSNFGSTGIPDLLFNQLESLNKTILDLNTRLSEGGLSDREENRISSELHDLIRDKTFIIDSIRITYPNYYFIQYDSVLLSISDIQKELDNKTQLLEYYWGVQNIYVVSMTDEHFSFDKIPRDATMDASIDSLIRMLTTVNAIATGYSDVNRYSRWSQSVYKNLFEPFLQKEHLIVIPDGPIAFLPVEALVVNEPVEGATFKNLDYILNHHKIQYGYSANILFNSISEKKRLDGILAMAYSEGEGESVLGIRSAEIGEIPGTAREIQRIKGRFRNVKDLYGHDATKAAFLSLAPNYDIIHLAVHGIADPDNLNNSRLLFQADSAGEANLMAYEIYNLRLKAGLAVLSGCESGIGREQSSEGLFSIARAFVYAGCPSVLMSLWRVPDRRTADLMDRFYRHIRKGESLVSATRKAKLDFLNNAEAQDAFPGNWAAFVINGADGDFRIRSSILLYVFVGLLILVIAFLLRKQI